MLLIRCRVDGTGAVRAGKLRSDALVRPARTDPLGRGFLVILRGAMDKSAYDAHVAERKKSAATTT